MSPTTTSTSFPSRDATLINSDDELNVEVAALLARGAQDMGEPTEAVQLDTLTDAEKRVLLALLRERMGTPPVPTEFPLATGGRP